MRLLWIYRSLLNWHDVFSWAHMAGVKKMIPPEQLHLTLASIRQKVDWGLTSPHEGRLVIPPGHKTMQIFGYTVKALAFGDPYIKARHEELARIFPNMDHAEMLRPHVSLYRGGKFIYEPYMGSLIFGPEVMEEFDEVRAETSSTCA